MRPAGSHGMIRHGSHIPEGMGKGDFMRYPVPCAPRDLLSLKTVEKITILLSINAMKILRKMKGCQWNSNIVGQLFFPGETRAF